MPLLLRFSFPVRLLYCKSASQSARSNGRAEASALRSLRYFSNALKILPNLQLLEAWKLIGLEAIKLESSNMIDFQAFKHPCFPASRPRGLPASQQFKLIQQIVVMTTDN
jgi:hypothetical protein